MSNIRVHLMSMTRHILIFIIAATLVSCGKPNRRKENIVVTADTLQKTLDKKEQEGLEKRREIEEKDNTDSLRSDKVLQDALKIANQNISKDWFIEKYTVSSDSLRVSVEIILDYHFTKANPHLIIRRNEPDAIYIDIYSKGASKFEKVVSREQWIMTYVNDTIRDINGDGINDFVVNWYGAAGCCLKAVSDVYLLRHDKRTFSASFEFINPTFSPTEKIIRGVCYGHPGETELYKYIWNGEQTDTLEYVSYEKNDKGVKTGKVIISSDRPYGDKFKALKVLDSVPTEYKNIEGYYWFAGLGYNKNNAR